MHEYYTVSQRNDTKLLFISSPNIDRFLKFFHCYTQQEICNKKLITDLTTPKDVATLPCEILIYKTETAQKRQTRRAHSEENVTVLGELALSQ